MIKILYSYYIAPFFEPNVPYNLIKIYLSGIKKVIKLAKNDLKILSRLITR